MAVSLAEVISVRRLVEAEVWALLCQSAQALRDALLSNDGEMVSVALVTPKGLKVTPRGRVFFDHPPKAASSAFTAPEVKDSGGRLTDVQLEKTLIYSLGASVQRAADTSSLSHDLTALLQAMTAKLPESRATLMDVLDGVADHCVVRVQSRPFSHLLMDLHGQVLAQEKKNAVCKGDYSAKDGAKSPEKYSTPTGVEKKRSKVQRAGSRLYRADLSKYHCPNTCVGPEFIVRSSNPPKAIHIGDIKPALRRKLVIILLNGQKLDITCDPSSITAANIFEVIVESECLEQNFLLGLAMLVSGDFVFLAPETRLCKVAPTGWIGESRRQPYYSFTLYLRIIFYLPSLRGVGSWTTKHMLYLQIRRGLLEHQIRCSASEMKSFASLALQAEFGDYNPDEHGNGDYFLVEHYIAEHFLPSGNIEQELVTQLLDLHKSRKGLDPGRAEELFVAQAMQLPEYGSHFYSALSVNPERDISNVEVWLGISGRGISVCPKHLCTDLNSPRFTLVSRSKYFLWNDIKKLCYSKQSFEIISQEKSVKLKLKMDTNKSFSVFRLASLHHKFFLKLRTEMSSLQSLAAEFGIPVKSGVKDGTKTVYYLGSASNRTNESFLKRSASFFSPERVIFRGKTASHCRIEEKLSRSCLGKNEEECSSKQGATGTSTDIDDCVWEKSPLALEQEHESAPASLCTESTQVCNRRARAPLMGTRAFLGASQAELHEPQSPLPQAYVLNSSIKSVDDRYHVDFQETISESLAEKFDEIPFVDERILTTVRIIRDENGSFGIQVTEGSDGGVYIRSIVPGGRADLLGIIHKGDQIQAVDGQNVMNLQYSSALQLLQEAGACMELVLAQKNRGQEVVQHSNLFNYTPGETTGTDLLAALVQKPIEESYFRVIRYETETETDEKMIDTTLPRNSHKESGSQIANKDRSSSYL